MLRGSTSIVISHWYKLIEDLQASPSELYPSIEHAIRDQNIPDARSSRIDWQEAGTFSATREYLRMCRGKHTIDICGAPFGNGFFISWWLAETRPSPVIPGAAALGAICVLWYLFYSLGGFFFSIFLLIAAFFAVGAFLSQSPEEEWVSYLLVIPVIGHLWERIFCPATYYRIDTALMFQTTVHAAVLGVVDSMTSAKGLRALTETERKPIMKEFFQR